VDNAIKKKALSKCVTHFSEVRASATDGERSGLLATSRTEENIAKSRHTVRENRQLSGI
jgi:hypothetical protein